METTIVGLPVPGIAPDERGESGDELTGNDSLSLSGGNDTLGSTPEGEDVLVADR